jgi:phage terminase large subunit GpA-like protein
VYQWVRTQRASRVMAIKGVPKGPLPVGQPSPVDVTISGRVIKQGLRIRSIVVPFFKSELYADLKLEKPTDQQLTEGWKYPTGYCHFPVAKNYADEHFRQVCAEQLVATRDRKTGRTKREWQQLRARNEGLDIRVYARAAAWELGIDRYQDRHWRDLEWRLTADLFQNTVALPASEGEQPAIADACKPAETPAPRPSPAPLARPKMQIRLC